jgi:hypothetical protein
MAARLAPPAPMINAGFLLPSPVAATSEPYMPCQSVFVPTRDPSGRFHTPLHALRARTWSSTPSRRGITVRLCGNVTTAPAQFGWRSWETKASMLGVSTIPKCHGRWMASVMKLWMAGPRANITITSVSRRSCNYARYTM